MRMDFDRFDNAHDETLLKRRPWYVLAVALLLLSAVTRQPIAFLAALFAFVIASVPEIWYRLALRHLALCQQVNQKYAFFGETLTLSISVENQKLLPLPWLEIEDEIPEHLTLLTGHSSSGLQSQPGDAGEHLLSLAFPTRDAALPVPLQRSWGLYLWPGNRAQR